MKRSIILLSLVMSLVMIIMFAAIPLIIAEQTTAPTQQYNKIFLNPFYRASMTNNNNYTYNVSINSPDGISQVSSAIISLQVYLTPTVTFSIWVNGVACNTPTYTVSTTFASSGQGIITFDCSNRITAAGIYNVTIRPSSANTGASTAWLDLTYMNNPSGALTIHGTEYTYGQTGKVWLQLLNSSGSNVNDAVCYVDIYTPNGGYLIEGATMTNMVHDGIYYYDLVIPIRQGVYPAIARCYYIAGQNKRNATSYVLTTGTVNTQTIINATWILDLDYLSLKTAGGAGNNRMNATFNFSDYYTNCGNVSELLMTGLTIYWNGQWITGGTNHDIYIYAYNYTSASWITLSNKILGGSNTATLIVTNSFSTTNVTTLLGINASRPLLIKFADNANSEGTKDWKTDYMYASCDQLTSPIWQSVMGSSELHISNPDFFVIDNGNYNITNTTLITTLYNGTNISEIYYTGIFRNLFTVQSGSLASKLVSIEYQGLHSIPCNSIISFYMVNSSGYYPWPFTTQRQTTEDHCSINFNLTIDTGMNYQFEAHARNSWESDLRSTNTGLGSIYPLIDGGCRLWQIVKGLPAYIVPKNQTNEIYNYYYRACANFYDDYYWFNKTYQQSLIDKTVIADEQGYLQYESDYSSAKFAEDKLNIISIYLLDNLGAVNDYSKLLIDNPLGDSIVNTTDQRYWANISTLYATWKMINDSCGTGKCRVNGTDVWNYTEGRNLTYIPTVNASITGLQLDADTYNNISNYVWNSSNRSLTYTDNIASGIWNYSGAIGANVIQTLVNNTWAYTGTISSNILNQFTNSTWTYQGNGTTYMIQAVVNSTWAYTGGRYTNGVVLS